MDTERHDLQEDLVEIVALADSARARLEDYVRRLEDARDHIYDAAFGYAHEVARQLGARFATLRTTIVEAHESDTKTLKTLKREQTQVLRMLMSSLSTTLAMSNWQSPSFSHTAMSQAGIETGNIKPSYLDYKRDVYTDLIAYEQKFLKEYVDQRLLSFASVLCTASGMAAVTTALVALEPKTRGGVVLAGKSSYFQNKWILEHLFGERLVYVDEFDTEEILRVAQEKQPSIVFLDSVCGAQMLPMPNLSELIPALARLLPRESTLIVDNTGLASTFQPLAYLPLTPLCMSMVVVESLLKYHQFGLDRVNGGVLIATGGLRQALFDARMHLGTIMPDVALYALPEPNRKLLERRLLRIGRNAQMLAEALSRRLPKEVAPQYPGLPEYKGYSWSNVLEFKGGFLALSFATKKVAIYDAFVGRVLANAKARGLDIVGGTSFGFNTSRVYVTARYATGITEPFVRIAVGTETVAEIQALTDAIVEAV